MFTLKTLSTAYYRDKYYFITSIVILAALTLTIISYLQLCTLQCVEAHKYRFLGLKFETFGLIFFITVSVVHCLIPEFPKLYDVEALLFSSALGAEIMFMIIQKFIIGTWCPICLSIAFCVLVGAGTHFVRYRKNLYIREETMNRFKRGISSLSVGIIGFTVAFFGVTKYDKMEAAQESIKENLVFGKTDSPIEVYLFTDWACPACRKLEPNLERMSREIMRQAKLVFVDHAIHPETLNFMPYHLSFQIKNKPQYFKLRQLLTEISEETGSPTEEEIAAVAAKIGVKYDELNYSDVALGIKYFRQLGEKFKITGTPTMVIINVDSKKGKKLTGNGEINLENVKAAIEKLRNT